MPKMNFGHPELDFSLDDGRQFIARLLDVFFLAQKLADFSRNNFLPIS